MITLAVAIFSTPGVAQKSVFYGGSGHIMAQNTVASNIFVGYQISNNFAIIANHYAKDVVSVDVLYKGFVISKGFSLRMKKDCEFLTILQTPKVYESGKWKIFAKIGINAGGPINKAHYSRISTLFGFGLRWN